MQCTDFEKQVIADVEALSPEQQRHALGCKSCQDFLKAYGLALAPPAPSAELDAAVRRQVAGVLRWQRQRRRLKRFGQAVLGVAAALVISMVVWRLMAPVPTPTPTSSPAHTADYWLLECALTDAALDDLEMDLGLQAALNGDFRVTAVEASTPVLDDVYRDLSNQLLMLEFDLYDSL